MASEKVRDKHSITMEDIVNRAGYHSPSAMGVKRHAALSEALTHFLGEINAICPAGREKSLAITHAEESKFWASAAVARNEDTV